MKTTVDKTCQSSSHFSFNVRYVIDLKLYQREEDCDMKIVKIVVVDDDDDDKDDDMIMMMMMTNQ